MNIVSFGKLYFNWEMSADEVKLQNFSSTAKLYSDVIITVIESDKLLPLQPVDGLNSLHIYLDTVAIFA